MVVPVTGGGAGWGPGRCGEDITPDVHQESDAEMQAGNGYGKLIEEIELFIEFSVDEASRELARSVVRRYGNDPLGLAVLREFYAVLPEAREEAVEKIYLLDRLQGVQLLVVATASHAYSVAATESEVHILGEYPEESLPEELIRYFGYRDEEEFRRRCGLLKTLPEYGEFGDAVFCPVCHVAAGEYHLPGCPVEICPWCDGQLSRCNCRFEQLDTEELENEEQLELFLEKLEAKGRVLFTADQKPAYPGTSEGLDRGK